MTMLCRSLDYAECPFWTAIPRGLCDDACALSTPCPVSLTECEQQCPDARCSAIEEG